MLAVEKTAPQAGKPTIAPRPPGLPVIGNLMGIRFGGHRYYEKVTGELGDIFRLQVGPMVLHVLSNPDHIRRILIDNKENYIKGLGYKKAKLLLGNGLFVSEGLLWQKQRRLMQPPFTAKSIPAFAQMMVDSTVDMLERWDGFHARGETFEMNAEMVRITMSIVGKTMLGVDLATEGKGVSQALMEVLDYVGRSSVSLIDIPLAIPTPGNVRFKRSIALLDGVVERIMEHHRTHDEEANNLLAMMIKAKDPVTGEGMSADQLRDEIITIFLAGHETTALLLTWTWYQLSQNPEVEAKFHAELEAVLGGRLPAAEDLPKLPYSRMIVEETLRMYPPVWMFPRDAVADDVIGGHHIPAGSMLLMSPYLAHKDPRFWDQPERFLPERFAGERGQTRPRNAYMPFGAGPRTCIGNHFAAMEAQLVLAAIGQRFRAIPVPGQDMEPTSVATFRPKNGLFVKLEKR